MRSLRKYFEFAALLLLAVGLIWWFGRKLDWTEVRASLMQANWYLLSVAVLIISAAYLFRAFRWGALLSPLGPARIKDLFAATTLGFSAVFLIGRTGEVVRPAVLPMRDPSVRASASLVTILIERVYDLMAVVLLFAFSLIWLTPPTNVTNEFFRLRISGAILLIVAIVGIGILIWYRRQSRTVIHWFRRFFERLRFMPRRLAQASTNLLEQLAAGLRVLVDTRELAITVAWTALVWLSIGFANMLVFLAFGLPFGPVETIFILGWSLAGSLVPTPGGAAGAFHAVTAAGLIFLGVTRETAAAVSIVLHIVDFGPAVLFGFFYFIRGDMSIGRLRALLNSKAVVTSSENISPGEKPIDKELRAASAND